MKRINPLVCTHHIYIENEAKPVCQPRRRLNPHMQEVVRVEVLKLLQAGIIYPISDSLWVSPTQVVPKKSGIMVVQNNKGEDVSTYLTTGWRVCIDYRRLNAVTRNDHFPLPFIDQVLERVSGHHFYYFLDGYSGYFQIEIDVEDQEKTTFTCPFGTYYIRAFMWIGSICCSYYIRAFHHHLWFGVLQPYSYLVDTVHHTRHSLPADG